MIGRSSQGFNMLIYCLILLVMTGFALVVGGVEAESARQQAGRIIFSLGFVLLSAFVIAQMVQAFRLPLITGYLLAGVIAGPYVTGFLSTEMVQRLRLIDDLALSFIALTAGGELRLSAMKQRARSILLNIFLITLVVFALVMGVVLWVGRYFDVTSGLSPVSLVVFALLIAVISVARSPSSTIAVIDECRASGPFTETVLSVTVVTDVLVIILFTIAIAVSRIIMAGGGVIHLEAMAGMGAEILVSLLLGGLLGKGISFYIERIGQDFILFLLFVAFGVTQVSLGLYRFMDLHFQISLHLEPLLICMAAGFFVVNFSRSGQAFMECLEQISMPIYALFFSIAGAALNFESLMVCWPLALCLAVTRAAGLFSGSWAAGVLSRDPRVFNRSAWMAYITQAGVTIGLAQLAARQFPGIGVHLNTVVLAIIVINQIVGPITFKVALSLVGESGKR